MLQVSPQFTNLLIHKKTISHFKYEKSEENLILEPSLIGCKVAREGGRNKNKRKEKNHGWFSREGLRLSLKSKGGLLAKVKRA